MQKSVIIFSLAFLTLSEASDIATLETFSIWIALFTLAVVGVVILFVSSMQTRKVERLHKTLFDKQLEMEKNQTILLTNMSEKIHTIAKQAFEKHQNSANSKSKPIENKEKLVESVENKLLDVTNDLIDFLRLKSKKVEIINEGFNINNVLNELSGSLASQFLGTHIELIFDIDKNIPRNLVGDSLHLGQILEAISSYLIEQPTVDEVKLEILMFDTFDENREIQFQFKDVSEGLSPQVVDNLFIPYYDEETEGYVGLGLFVANELIGMMGGELSVCSVEGKGSTFTLSLPFRVPDKIDKRSYRLPRKALIEKKVSIIDLNYNAALAIKKLFAYFKHEVKVISAEKFAQNMPNLSLCDIVIIHETLFTPRVVNYLTQIKRQKELKVIAMNSMLRTDKKEFSDPVIDVHIFTPLNQERIFEMIIHLYKEPTERRKEFRDALSEQTVSKVKIHKTDMVETKNVTREKFEDFSGKKILIVEDNFINQKVLTSLFLSSGLEITLANNGQEAVTTMQNRANRFDIVLMDINMPIMDGYTATQIIRRDSYFDSLPIVAFTALALESEIEKMFQSGISAFLLKPLNIGKLYTALDIYLMRQPIKTAKKPSVVPKKVVTYEGINIQKGIAHTNHNESLYLEVLKEFIEAYGTSDTLFSKLVEEHRFEQIKMLCVDMRGLSGSIGAEDMHHLTNEVLNKLLYKEYEVIANFKERYIFEIQRLNKSIKKYIQTVE